MKLEVGNLYVDGAHSAAEELDAALYDEVGEVAGDWQILDNEVMEAIAEAIKKVVEEKTNHEFFTVADVQEHSPPAKEMT